MTRMETAGIALLLGFLLDLLLGDPQTLWHPVRGIGWIITKWESVLRKAFPQTQRGEMAGGILLVVGVIAYNLFSFNIPLAAAMAVSCAIVGMLVTNTTHPPGGATALIAVIGGDSVHKLGLMYAFSPVLIGALIMLLIAVIVNNFSRNKDRHYPKYWI